MVYDLEVVEGLFNSGVMVFAELWVEAEKLICLRCVYKFMSAVIPVRVPREVAERIKRLVDLGLYPNRSDLVREALRRLLAFEDLSWQRSVLGKTVANLASYMIAWNEKSVSDVILFGSVARGEAGVESDVDLLVLVENAEGWVIRGRIYDLIYPFIPVFGVDISLIVLGKDEFVEMIKRGDPFAVSVLEEGVQLHGGLLGEYSKGTSG